MNTVLLHKEHPSIPDSYTIEVNYITGGIEEYQCVGHGYPQHLRELCLELILKSDEYLVIPMTSIKNVRFKKDFVEFRKLQEEKAK